MAKKNQTSEKLDLILRELRDLKNKVEALSKAQAAASAATAATPAAPPVVLSQLLQPATPFAGLRELSERLERDENLKADLLIACTRIHASYNKLASLMMAAFASNGVWELCC